MKRKIVSACSNVQVYFKTKKFNCQYEDLLSGWGAVLKTVAFKLSNEIFLLIIFKQKTLNASHREDCESSGSVDASELTPPTSLSKNEGIEWRITSRWRHNSESVYNQFTELKIPPSTTSPDICNILMNLL